MCLREEALIKNKQAEHKTSALHEILIRFNVIPASVSKYFLYKALTQLQIKSIMSTRRQIKLHLCHTVYFACWLKS